MSPGTSRDPDFAIYLVVGLCLVALVAAVIAHVRKKPLVQVVAPAPVSVAPPVAVDAGPLCKCGAPATRPSPEVFADPPWYVVALRWFNVTLRYTFPRYAVRVPERGPLAHCDAHGHLADVLAAQELAEAVTKEKAECEVRIVRRVTGFITSAKSGLDARVIDAMTDDQKADYKARAKAAEPKRSLDNVVQFPKAANGE